MADDRPDVATPPSSAQVGLLNYLTANSLDADYAHVHQRRLSTGESRPHAVSGRRGLLSAVALAGFGLLIIIAATQAQRTAGEQAQSRDALLQDINDRRDALEELRNNVGQARLRLTQDRVDAEQLRQRSAAAEREATKLGLVTGAIAARGEGIRIVVDDDPNSSEESHRVLDVDLRNIANGLREAGAEAIAINGQRLTARTAIRFAGRQITVNYVSLQRPYTVEAIGDSDQLQARFAESSSGLAFLVAAQSNQLEVSSVQIPRLTLPAANPARLRLPVLGERSTE